MRNKHRTKGASLQAVQPALAYTVEEAARLVKSSRSHLYKQIEARRLRSYYEGGRRISHDALVAYVAMVEDESDAETRWRR